MTRYPAYVCPIVTLFDRTVAPVKERLLFPVESVLMAKTKISPALTLKVSSNDARSLTLAFTFVNVEGSLLPPPHIF